MNKFPKSNDLPKHTLENINTPSSPITTKNIEVEFKTFPQKKKKKKAQIIL